MHSKIDTLKSWLQGRKPVAKKKEETHNEVRVSDMPRYIKGMKRYIRIAFKDNHTWLFTMVMRVIT
jgi:nicotinamide riboside kinase